MTELATISHGSSLALDADQPFWNDYQLATLRQMGLDQAGNGDLAVFMHVSQRTGLDPFAKQIYMIGRWSKDGTKYTIQTGIDGFRLIARRASDRLNETLEYEDTLWCGPDGEWTEAWVKATAPAAAKVTVLRHGKRFSAVAIYREYVQTVKSGDPNAMWSRMPANQLAKCAEALALRKAFPQDLSGIYADEEMAQADRPDRQEPPSTSLAEQVGAAPTISGPEAPEQGDHTPPVEHDDSGPESPLLDVRSDLAKAMYASIHEAGIPEDERITFLGNVIGREIGSSKEMTEDEARTVLAFIDAESATQTGVES